MVKYFVLFLIGYSCLMKVYAYNNLAKPEWFLQIIENKHKSELSSLSRVKQVSEPTMFIKQYKDTSTYIVSSLYGNKNSSGVILLALIDKSSKKVLASTAQKIEIFFSDENSIKVDLSYDNISKNLSFAVLLTTYIANVTPTYLREDIYLYEINNFEIIPLLSKFLIKKSHFLRGAECYTDYNEIKYTRYLKNKKQDNTIYFSGYYKHIEEKYKTQDISNQCFPKENKMGRLNIRLQMHNGRYEITKKTAIINNSSFKNLYQISKIFQISIDDIIKLNPNVKVHKLKLGDEVNLPFKNN